MSTGVNKAILIGNLGNDPDIKTAANGTMVANISVATSFPSKNEATGQWKEQTEWHKVVMFGKLAEICNQYLRKGSQVYIEGRLQTKKWQKDGQDRYTTQIVANEMKMLGKKQSDEIQPADSAYQERTTMQPTTAKPQPTAQKPPHNFEDDIPF